MRPYLLILAAASLWALIGVLSKGILAAGVSPLEIAFWRAALAGGAFVAHAALAGRLRLERRGDLPAFALFALVGVTLFFASLVLAIDAGGVSLAFILLYSAPAWVALLARLLLRERLGPRKIGLVALSVAGVVLVARGGGQGVTPTVPALAWGLAAGLSYASYYIFGRWVLARYAPATVYAFALPFGALGLLPLVDFAPKTPTAWLLLGVLALVSTYLAYLVYYTGLREVEATRAVLVATVEPVIAAALAAVLFGERIGLLGLLGGALVLAAAALSALPGRTRPAGSSPPAG